MANVGYGPRALELLAKGMAPERVIAELLAEDPDPYPETWPEAGRQVAVMDAAGQVSAWTGDEAPEWAGHRTGEHVSVQGNLLGGPAVLDGMIDAFERTQDPLLPLPRLRRLATPEWSCLQQSTCPPRSSGSSCLD